MSGQGEVAARRGLEFVEGLVAHGLVVRLPAEQAHDLGIDPAAYSPEVETTSSADDAGHGCEIAVVLGGDGTILRAAEITHASGTPLLGVNLGHVGFLAEAESDATDATLAAVVNRDYSIEDRLTIEQGKVLVDHTPRTA